MFIVNFIFVYILAGFILGNLLIILSKKSLHTTLAYLLGYGIAPLAISVMLYYLYWCFPHRGWFFYTIIIDSVWLIVLAICLYDIKIQLRPRDFISVLQKLSITGKVLIGVIVFIVGFTFIRGQLYPTLWADAIYYFQQGHVYSVDRSLDRLTTQIPFLEDGSGYMMNQSIRPAIPLLYSFFYTTPASQDIFIFSGGFLYFYYFILLLGMFCHILKRLRYDHDRIVLGLVLLVSSYYLINFLIFGFKEIILMFFILTALWTGYNITEYTARTKWLLSMCLGAFVGLALFINVSGVIIGGIIGLIYLIELFAHKVPFKQIVLHSIVIGFFLTLFSGGELRYGFDFIFKRTLLDTSSTIGATAASELTSYKIIQPEENPEENLVSDTPADTSSTTVVATDVVATEPDTSSIIIDEGLDPNQSTAQAGLKKQILLKGKLQGFTQIQFYGIIFWLFATILVVHIIQHRQFIHFEKSILGFFGLFFLIVMDPLFLNLHPQAYVLSISPKYTILLIPLAALFIVINYDVLLKLFAKINLYHLLVSSVGILLLLPSVRGMVVPYTLNLFEIVIPLYNVREYYLHKFDLFYIGVGVLFLIVNTILCYFIIVKAAKQKKVAMISLLFVTGSFIFPFLFLLNNNYHIINTFRNISATKETKLEMTETNEDALAYLDAIHYLNTKTDPTTKILFFYYRPSVYYLEDYHRFVTDSYIGSIDESNKSIVYVQDADYIVVRKTDLELYNFSQAVEVEQEFNSVVLLQVFY